MMSCQSTSGQPRGRPTAQEARGSAAGAHLDPVRVRVDHEVVEPLQHCVVVARVVPVADLRRLEVRERVDVRALRRYADEHGTRDVKVRDGARTYLLRAALAVKPDTENLHVRALQAPKRDGQLVNETREE